LVLPLEPANEQAGEDRHRLESKLGLIVGHYFDTLFSGLEIGALLELTLAIPVLVPAA
jgi:hypothetical protein